MQFLCQKSGMRYLFHESSTHFMVFRRLACDMLTEPYLLVGKPAPASSIALLLPQMLIQGDPGGPARPHRQHPSPPPHRRCAAFRCLPPLPWLLPYLPASFPPHPPPFLPPFVNPPPLLLSSLPAALRTVETLFQPSPLPHFCLSPALPASV